MCKTIVVIFFFCYKAISQPVASGIVINEEGTPVMYANIGVPKRVLGTVSDEKGFFSFDLKGTQPTDTVVISCIGHSSVSMSLKELMRLCLSGKEVTLERRYYSVEEVVIRPRQIKRKSIGNKREVNVISGGFQSNQLGNEVGILIKSKDRKLYLDAFNFHISANSYDTVLFRLNLYSLKDGLPEDNILKEPIFVETTLQQGNVSVMLKEYNLCIEEDFVVSLEWLKDLGGTSGLYFSASITGPDMFFREASQSEWKKTDVGCVGFWLDVSYEKD